MENIKKQSTGKLLGLLLIGIAVCSFTPIIKTQYVLFVLEFLAIMLALRNSGSGIFRRNIRLVVCIYLYLLLCLIYYALGISSAPSGAMIKHFGFFVCILLMLLIRNNITEKQNDWILLGIIIVILVNIIDNIRLCLMYPEIMVMVNRDMGAENLMGDISINIGSSRFYNALFFFFTLCLFAFLNCLRKRWKRFFLICVVLTAVFLFAFCLKAAVIVFTCFSGFLLIMAKRSSSFKKFALRIVVPAFVIFVFVSIFSDLIIEMIFNLTSSERLAQRLILLIDSDNPEADAGAVTLSARGNLWLMSINTWLDNPINFLMGIGDHRANWAAGETAADTGIGQHSDFFDSFARYGLFGAFLLIPILIISFKYIVSVFDKEYRLQLVVIILIFVMYGITKGVFQSDIGFMLFVFLPLSAKYLNRSKTIT